MRKINTRTFRLATRRTQRDVNRRIVLNLIREYQPISRAELSRRMLVRRAALTTIVRELIETGAVQETGAAATVRGRRPMMLSLRQTEQLVAAADVRPHTTYLALADTSGRLVARGTAETPLAPEELGAAVGEGIERLLASYAPARTVAESCLGVGVVVPGMIDRRSGRVIYAPRLGWRDVELRSAVAERLGIRTFIESAPIACAMARLWLAPDQTRGVQSFAYVHISDGIGVGLVLNGEPIRGETHSAGEFGHIALDASGPRCACGRHGCWEALASNSATIARYVAASGGERASSERPSGERASIERASGDAASPKKRAAPELSIAEVLRRARQGEPAAVEAIVATARHIGRGLVLVVSAFNPGRIYLGGEITAAWELLEGPIREALAEGAITEAAAATPVTPDGNPGEQRLRGAVALVNAPSFAAPAVG